MGILIRRLDVGFLVTDNRLARAWEASAATLDEAELLARGRVTSPVAAEVRYSPDSGGQALADRQYGQALGDIPPCMGSLCGSD